MPKYYESCLYLEIKKIITELQYSETSKFDMADFFEYILILVSFHGQRLKISLDSTSETLLYQIIVFEIILVELKYLLIKQFVSFKSRSS
jgi:hypothetical protein